MNAISWRTPPALTSMLASIAAAVRAPEPVRHECVAQALAHHLTDPELLAGRTYPSQPDRYCRHLLHNDPVAGYAVVAIVWRPGQMSPVHGHRTWCAFGVHRGWLAETYFTHDGQATSPSGCYPRGLGSTGHTPPDAMAIHRLANLGTREALSIHVYGVAFERFADGVNEVYAA